MRHGGKGKQMPSFLKHTFLHGVRMAGMYDGRSVSVAYGTAVGTNIALEEEEEEEKIM